MLGFRRFLLFQMISPALENTGVLRKALICLRSSLRAWLDLFTFYILSKRLLQFRKLSYPAGFLQVRTCLSLWHTTAKVCLPCPVFLFVYLFWVSFVVRVCFVTDAAVWHSSSLIHQPIPHHSTRHNNHSDLSLNNKRNKNVKRQTGGAHRESTVLVGPRLQDCGVQPAAQFAT